MRWALVAALISVLIALPSVVAAWRTQPDTVSAAELLRKIQNSTNVGYSGYAQSTGGLALPVTTQFTDLVDLVGGTTQMRTWRRSSTDWRVDVVSAVGERDVIRDPDGTWAWDYQAATAVRTEMEGRPAAVRLPVAGDVLPTELGHRLLSQATPAEVSRLPVARIAGRDAPGLRLRPAQPQTSIDHVDVWADPTTGLPVRVAIYGAGSATPALMTSFLDLSTTTPAAHTIAFHPPPGTSIRFQKGPQQADIVSAVDRFSRARPPTTLAGLARSPGFPALGAVGVYGRGVTELVAVPLPDRIAGSLRSQLAHTRTAITAPDGSVSVAAGPLGLLLTTPQGAGRSWLLGGTVTMPTLLTAAADLTGAQQ